MSKKSIICAALAAVFLIISIVLTVVLFGSFSSLPKGADRFKNIVNGCSKMSSSAVQDSYGRSSIYSAPSLIGCETVDDYMKACGMRFGYMSEDGCTTQKVYFVSASAVTEDEYDWFGQDEFSFIQAVVGADYVNSEGETNTAYKNFTVICSKKGGVLAIS